MRLAIFTVLILLLGGCGGGGTSESNPPGNPPPSADTTPPQISVTSNVDSQWAGGEVTLAASASDNSDSSPVVSISCDRGSLDGLILTLPADPSVSQVKCIADAEDASGNSASDEVTVEIKPVAIILENDPDEIFAGGALVFSYDGPGILAGEVEATLAGTPVTDIGVDGQVIAFILPFGFEGPAEIGINIDGIAHREAITVKPEVVIDDPRQLVMSAIDRSLAAMNESPGLYEEQSEALVNARADLENLTYDELNQTAHLLYHMTKFTEGSAPEDAARPAFSAGWAYKNSADICNDSAARMAFSVAKTAGGIGIATVGAAVVKTGIGASAGTVVTIVGLGYTIYNTKLLLNSFFDVYEHCVSEHIVSIVEEIEGYIPGMEKTLARDLGAIEFREGDAKSLGVNVTYRIEDEKIRSDFLVYTSLTIQKLKQINSILNGYLSTLIRSIPTTDERTERHDADLYVLSEISDPNIGGGITSSNNETLSINFEHLNAAEIPENGISEFTFMLKNRESGNAVHQAAMLVASDQPKLEVTFDGKDITSGSVVAMPLNNAMINVKNTGFGALILNETSTSDSDFFLQRISGEPRVLSAGESESFTLNYVGGDDENETTVYIGDNSLPDLGFSFIVKQGCVTNIYLDGVKIPGYECATINLTGEAGISVIFRRESSLDVQSMTLRLMPVYSGPGTYHLSSDGHARAQLYRADVGSYFTYEDWGGASYTGSVTITNSDLNLEGYFSFWVVGITQGIRGDAIHITGDFNMGSGVASDPSDRSYYRD